MIRRHITWRVSPLLLRILAVNVSALVILGIGLLYSGQYERELIRTDLNALKREGMLLASAIAESGSRRTLEGTPVLAEDLTRHMLRKLAESNSHRTLVFASNGQLILDTHQMLGPGGVVEVIELDPPESVLPLTEILQRRLQKFISFLPTRLNLPRLRIQDRSNAQDYPKVMQTLDGQTHTDAWRDADNHIVFTASLPVRDIKNVIGAILIMQDGRSVDVAVKEVQFTVIKIFLYTLLITVLLSAYLAHTIARPVMRLAQAADKVRQSLLFRDAVPDFSYRYDEIGTLSIAFREMTEALAERVDAISNFAADVAHEIKNPLASVKSAVETLSRVKDDAQRSRLTSIIDEDVNRINRLITDISNASRVDSEVSRSEKSSFDLKGMVQEMVRQVDAGRGKVILDVPKAQEMMLLGSEGQIFQIIQNILSNALSFVTQQGFVRVALRAEGARFVLTIDNDGPQIPEHKLEGIFARFYSERPKGEKFGLHSGLGLSISRQIATAHQGTIFAENLKSEDGTPDGVRFTVVLPRGVPA